MFHEKEEDIIAQSDLFPNYIDTTFIKAYGLFVEALNHLKDLLEENFYLRDYSIAKNYVILKVDKDHLSNVGVGVITHDLEDDQDLSGWISYKYFYDHRDILVYETTEDTIDYSPFDQAHEEEEEDYRDLDEEDFD